MVDVEYRLSRVSMLRVGKGAQVNVVVALCMLLSGLYPWIASTRAAKGPGHSTEAVSCIVDTCLRAGVSFRDGLVPVSWLDLGL